MRDEAVTWKRVREAAAALPDKEAAVAERSGWSKAAIKARADSLREALSMDNASDAVQALLEIVLMRDQLHVSEELPEELRFRLLEVMWLREWSLDEFKDALAGVRIRLPTVENQASAQIQALFEIAATYRRLRAPGRWPGRTERGQCAELMWLARSSEDETYQAAVDLHQRFGFGRGEIGKALDALRQIEVIYQQTHFGDELAEQVARTLAEVMWLRDWDQDKALAATVGLQNRLGLQGEEQALDALHAICLRCGGKERPNAVTEALDQIRGGVAASKETYEDDLMEFAEYMWLGEYTPQQAVAKLGRFARVNEASLYETLEVMLDLERQRLREEGDATDA